MCYSCLSLPHQPPPRVMAWLPPPWSLWKIATTSQLRCALRWDQRRGKVLTIDNRQWIEWMRKTEWIDRDRDSQSTWLEWIDSPINRAQFSQFAGASTSISRQDRRRLRDHRGNQSGADWRAIPGPLIERSWAVWRPGNTRTRSRLAVGGSRRTLPRLAHSPIQSAKRLN